MNVKNKLLLTTAVLMIAVPTSFAAAQEQKQEALTTWGEIEAGWRSYIKRPPQAPAGWGNADTVSYTHLTLPTNREV